jgi:hypothetical protein
MDVKSVKDMHHWCAKIGLFPVHIKDSDQISTLNHYAIENGIDLSIK